MKATAVILLFLVIFGITATLCAGRIGGQGERCLCKGNLLKRVKPFEVKNVQLFYPSASCSKTEILITFKNGNKSCLDPSKKLGKRILRGKIGKNPFAKRGKERKQKKNQQQQ